MVLAMMVPAFAEDPDTLTSTITLDLNETWTWSITPELTYSSTNNKIEVKFTEATKSSGLFIKPEAEHDGIAIQLTSSTAMKNADGKELAYTLTVVGEEDDDLEISESNPRALLSKDQPGSTALQNEVISIHKGDRVYSNTGKSLVEAFARKIQIDVENVSDVSTVQLASESYTATLTFTIVSTNTKSPDLADE